jgi:hypothetical protein
MKPHDEEKLERLIHETLRDLPRRRAPGTLEQRVMAEIERRAALPWWKQGFAHWPMPARAGFILAAGGVAKLALMAVVWILAGVNNVPFQEAFATQLAWIDTVGVVGHALTDFVSATIRGIPPLWLYGGLALVASLYTALFGLGAAAYRTLYAAR